MAPDRPTQPALRNVLVTGATGFVGRRVVERLLAQGIRVTAHGQTRDFHDVVGKLDRRFDGVESMRGDLSDYEVANELISSWRWSAVVNLAGPVTSGNEDLRTGIDVVRAHERIALHVKLFSEDRRIVHASSMTVYGMPEQVDVDELHPQRPLHLYGLAKLVAEDVLRSERDPDHVHNSYLLRLPGLFSEDRTTGALYHFCRAASVGQPIRITTPAPTPWSVLHVDDAVDAIMLALTRPSGWRWPINVAHDEPIELVAVAKMIAEIAGTGSPVECAVEHPPMRLVNADAKQHLHWSPPTLRARLTKLYEDYARAA